MLRILFVNPIAGKSAADLHVAAFVRAGRAAGHYIELVNSVGTESEDPAGTGPHRSSAPPKILLGWIGYLLRDIWMWLRDSLRSVRVTRQYIRRRSDFDLVYCRGGMTFFDSTGRRIAKMLGIPFLLELNAFPDIESDVRGRPLPLRSLLLRYSSADLNEAKVIFVVSDELARVTRSRAGEAKEVVVNPNGVDLDMFSPSVEGLTVRKSLGLEHEDVLVGYAGSFQPWQGAITLVEAFADAVRDNSPSRIHLLLIGEGTDAPLALRRARALGVEDRVHPLGRVPHDEMPEALAACDILTAPYEKLESFYFSPLKIFEYLALGKPIIASRAGQLEDILVDEVSAILVAPGDGGQLARALSSLVMDPSLRIRLGEGAYSLSKRYTWEQNFQRVANRAYAALSRTEFHGVGGGGGR